MGLVFSEEHNDNVIVLNELDYGEVIDLHGLFIALPKKPKKTDILFHDLPKKEQCWRRLDVPAEIQKTKSLDDWNERPKEVRQKYEEYISEEFRRRKEGIWFYNNGVPTYITGSHYMFLQWSKIDIGYPSFLN